MYFLIFMFGLCSNWLEFTAHTNTDFNINSVEMHLDHLWTTEDDQHWTAISSDEYEDNDEPVFVSNLIRDCNYDRASRLLRVKPILGVDSYSGFITVNHRYNSNLFFWLVPSQADPNNDPVVVWLMGAPEFSSMYAAFQENGPFQFQVDGNLTLNQNSWTKRYNMLYIDNPVGVGYSFTDNVAGFARNLEQVSASLYDFMVQFYEVFPKLRQNQLFIGGESNGAKYGAGLAYEIHEKNSKSHTKMNLTGLFFGNCFIDPMNMLEYSEYLYRLGIIDYQSCLDMHKLENNIKRLIRMEEWNQATDLTDQIYKKISEAGYDNPFDFTKERINLLGDQVIKYLNQRETKKQFHVGDTPFRNHELVGKYLQEDYFKSVKVLIENLLSYMKILFYSGQFDMLVTRPNMNKFTNKLRWADANRFAKQEPITWQVKGEVVGYVASVSNLTEVSVRNANHRTIASQPENVFRLFNLFVQKGSFTDQFLMMEGDDYF